MNVREVIRGWSLLRRVRGVFLLYAAFCAAGPFVQIFGTPWMRPWARMLLAGALLVLVGWWVRGWRRGRFVPVLEPLEWAVVGTVIACSDENDVAVNLIFGAVCFRAFYGNKWEWVRRLALVEVAFVTAPLVRGALEPAYEPPDPSLTLAVAVLALLMFVLKNALEQHERMVARERILAQGAAEVLAAPDRRAVYDTAVRTALGLAGEGSGVRTVLTRGDGLVTRIRAMAGDHLEGLEGRSVHFERMPPSLLDAFRAGEPIYLEGDACAAVNGVADVPVRQGGIFVVPIRTATTWLGTMSIGADRPLRPEIRTSMITWAAQVALSLERLRLNEELTRRAFHDSLTGLPNRALVHDRLRMALNARSDGHRVAFLLLDLDGFKQVNDGYGHKAGDELLCEVAKRLVGCVRQGDTVGRLGGDEFAVILPGVSDRGQAVAIAERLVAAVREPVTADGHPVLVGVSLGIAFADQCADDDLDGLVRAADTAMYQVKAGRGGGYAVFGAPVVA